MTEWKINAQFGLIFLVIAVALSGGFAFIVGSITLDVQIKIFEWQTSNSTLGTEMEEELGSFKTQTSFMMISGILLVVGSFILFFFTAKTIK